MKSEFESTQGFAPQLKRAASALDSANTIATFDVCTARAVDVTNDTIWRTVEFAALFGKNLTVVRELAAVTAQVMTGVATPLIGVARNIDPASHVPKDGAIDLQPLVVSVPAVEKATT